MLIIGYIAKKVKILKESDTALLNKIILMICLPAFVINAIMGSQLKISMFVTPGAGIICETLILLIAFLMCKIFRFSKELTLGVMFCSAFGNTGFLGYPVVASLFKDNLAMPAAVIFDQFGMQFFFLIAAPIIASWVIGGSEKNYSIKNFYEIFKKPVLITLFITLAFHTIKLPSFFMEATKNIGNAIIPLAMMSIGLNLKASSTLKYAGPLLIVIALKLMLLPLFMYFVVHALGVSGTVANVVIMQTSLATAVLAGILTTEYKGDGTFASAAIFTTTLVDIVMIPIVSSLLGIG